MTNVVIIWWLFDGFDEDFDDFDDFYDSDAGGDHS